MDSRSDSILLDVVPILLVAAIVAIVFAMIVLTPILLIFVVPIGWLLWMVLGRESPS